MNEAAAALRRHADELVQLMVREVGKPIAEARGEMNRVLGILRFYAQLCLAPVGEIFPTLITDRWSGLGGGR